MLNDLVIYFKHFESAFFWVIPVFLGFAFYGRSSLKRNAALDFILFAAVVTTLLRLIIFFTFNKLSGRHFLPEPH